MCAARPAKYLGSFPVCGGEHAARVTSVSKQLTLMKENAQAIPVLLVIALTGVKVCDIPASSVRMSHALRRISYATCEAARALFALVAREPRAEPSAERRAEPTTHYCHAFQTDTPQQAEELNALVGDAFRMAFASQLQPTAPLWSKELTGDCGMGVRAPDTLPGLTHHYPHCLERSPVKCNIMGVSKLVNDAASPTSSEESNSPTEVTSYRRLGERPPLMKRLAMGFSGALLQPSDDDSTPLVADTPTTPTNGSLCLSGNGGYINEASDEARRQDERDRATLRINDNSITHSDLDIHFRNCNNMKNSTSAACSHTTSSSSGASSCSRGSGNNNEPELKNAPWFQIGIPREIALEVLSTQPVGSFLVRGSSAARALALSVRVPREFAAAGIAHYLILTTNKGYKIKGFTKEFSTLSALVTHHSVMPELLPTPLRLPRPPRAPHHADLDALLPAHPPAPPVPPAPHRNTPQHHKYLAQLDV